MSKQLQDYSVLTFDCYGTLIDWESGIWDALQPMLHHNGRTDITRSVGLEAFAKTESAQEAATPGMIYADVLTHVHSTLAEQFQLDTTTAMDEAFGASVPHWPAFPDTADALRQLQHHFKLVILSNVSRGGFAASNRKLGVTFDAIYTAQDVNSYKPDPRNFEYMLERLAGEHNLNQADILHTAQSLFHDHVPAKSFGLACAWIDRQGLADSDNWGATAKVEKRPEVDYLFNSMQAMADAVTAEGK